MSAAYKRVAVVTGASAGIGEAIVRNLVASGAGVIGNARRADKLSALQAELGPAFHPVVGDASDLSVMDAMLDSAKSMFGTEADLIIANAGRGLNGSVLTADLSQFEEMVKVNLTGTVQFLQKAATRMLENMTERPFPEYPHDIVILGSIVGRHISPFSSVYGSTKFGVNSLAEALRREVGPKGIRVTLVEPGVVRSEFQDVAGYSDELVFNMQQGFGPLLIGDDVARAIGFIVEQPPHVHCSDIVIRPTRQEYP